MGSAGARVFGAGAARGTGMVGAGTALLFAAAFWLGLIAVAPENEKGHASVGAAGAAFGAAIFLFVGLVLR